jgi:hypothetical protein
VVPKNPVVQKNHDILESGVIIKVVFEACTMLELSEVYVLRRRRLSEWSMDPAMSVSMVNVFPNPISWLMLDYLCC